MSRRAEVGLVLVVTAIGLGVRAIPVAMADFPLNDGGLFAAMIGAIQHNGWIPPAELAWNGREIPFAYPPLGFYLSGSLAAGTPLDLVTIFRFLPLLFSAAVVPAVYLLAKELLGSRPGALMAAAVYGLAPSSYTWLIDGGGVTRAPGMLLAALTLWRLAVMLRAPTGRRALAVGLLAGLTVLTHPGAALFGAVAGAILVADRRSRAGLRLAAVAGVVAVLVTVPWFVLLAAGPGIGSFTRVAGNGPDPVTVLVTMLAARRTGLGFPDPLSALMLAAALLGLVRRRWALPVLWLATELVSVQYGIVFGAMLVGYVASDLFSRASEPDGTGARRIGRVGIALLAVMLAVEAGGSALAVYLPDHLFALTTDRRSAIAWAGANLPVNAKVAVITGGEWSTDPDSEWFFQLSGRTSVATVQGQEWLGLQAFTRAESAYLSLQDCAMADAECVVAWLTQHPADVLFIPKGQLEGLASPSDCCASVRSSLTSDPRFAVMYDGPGATIFGVVHFAP